MNERCVSSVRKSVLSAGKGRALWQGVMTTLAQYNCASARPRGPSSKESRLPQVLLALLAPKFIVVYLFVASALYVHLRGRVRHTLVRQLKDHSTLMAPYNALMYLFSAVPAKPFIDVAKVPELAQLRENWQLIREAALGLMNQ